jgi:uncharacterized membrane protein (GlpM family)
MSDTLVERMLISFVLGGCFVSLVAFIAQRAGSRWGGVIGGFPSVGLVTLVFLGAVEGPAFAARAAFMIPFGIACYGAFLTAYVFLFSRGTSFFLSVVAASAIWICLASAVFHGVPHTWIGCLSVYGCGVVLAYIALFRVLRVPEIAGQKIPIRIAQIALRAVGAGAGVAIPVLVSSVAGPSLGGVAAMFPAATLATITIAYLADGQPLSLALARPLFVSTMLNLLVFSFAVQLSYPTLGVFLGTLASIGAALISAGIAYQILKSPWARGRHS